MKDWKELGAGARAGIIGAGVIAVAVLTYFVARPPHPVPPPGPVASAPAAPSPATPAPAAPAPAPAPQPAPAPAAPAPAAPAPTPAAPAAPQGAAPAATPAEAPTPAATAPSFDVVRVTPDGHALVAGRGEGGATMAVQVDGAQAATAPVDAGGRFAAMFDLPAAAAPRTLTLRETLADGTVVEGSQSVLVAPTGTAVASAATPATPAPAATPGREAAPSTDSTAPVPGTAEAGSAPAAPAAASGGSTEAAAPQAPAVLLTDKGTVSVLQPGGPAVAQKNVGIDAISYAGSGAVELAGHGTPTANLRLYVDNKPVTTATIGSDGRWTLQMPEMAEGVHTLRADELDAAGQVISRFETPFKRESPAALKAAGVTGGPLVGVHAAIITVQPGYTLWGIAERNLGKGVLYVKVFQANRDQIRDPNLIYPGQVFAVPGAP